MPSTNKSYIQVQPDSNGNITITIKPIVIKLVLETAGDGAPAVTAAVTVPSVNTDQVNQTPRSIILLNSDSDSDNSTIVEQLVLTGTGNTEARTRPYSLRSRIQVEEDNSSDEEIDYELSQQVSNYHL